MKRRELRRHIFEMLFRIEFHSSEEMEEQLGLFIQGLKEEQEVTFADELYIREKYKSIIGMLPALDQVVSKASQGWKPSRMGKVELTILRLAVYEMQHDEDVPVGVAINEAVELAKEFGQADSSSFINGVLGKSARGQEDKEDVPDTESEDAEERKEPKAAPIETGPAGPERKGRGQASEAAGKPKKKVYITRHPERSSIRDEK
ncbi:MAG: transcription antitermination factor NusB [Lachnospiraceae bacterium]|nr:transcription antitermination factor NusB [Lachnospiraceae bacterium]